MDLTIQARTAVMSTTGFPENPPVRTGPSIVDFMAGVHLATGVLAALFQRERSGRGQHVEVSLQDAILPSLSSNIAGLVSSGGTMPERTGNQHGGMAVVPYNAYPTKDGWVTLLCPTQAHWERLSGVMGDPASSDPRFTTMKDRCDNAVAVDEIVGRWTSGYTKQEVVDLVAAHGIPAAPVLTLSELLVDEHIRARGVLRRENDDSGEWLTLGSPIFMSDSPLVEPTRTRPLGADTDDILTSMLGLSPSEIADLRARKAIG
jgi:formyl-CoA transferase